MFGISLAELVVILIMAFLIIGPARLAGFSHALGRGIHKLKDQLEVFKSTRLNDIDTSALYQAKVELDTTLSEMRK